MAEKIIKWLIFSVVLALLPFAFNYLRLSSRSIDPTFINIFGNGELLLVAAGIAAAAVGDLIGSGSGHKIAKLFAGGGSVVVLCLASLHFADVASLKNSPTFDADVVVVSSMWFFIFAIISGAGCISLGEV